MKVRIRKSPRVIKIQQRFMRMSLSLFVLIELRSSAESGQAVYGNVLSCGGGCSNDAANVFDVFCKNVWCY